MHPPRYGKLSCFATSLEKQYRRWIGGTAACPVAQRAHRALPNWIGDPRICPTYAPELPTPGRALAYRACLPVALCSTASGVENMVTEGGHIEDGDEMLTQNGLYSGCACVFSLFKKRSCCCPGRTFSHVLNSLPARKELPVSYSRFSRGGEEQIR